LGRPARRPDRLTVRLQDRLNSIEDQRLQLQPDRDADRSCTGIAAVPRSSRVPGTTEAQHPFPEDGESLLRVRFDPETGVSEECAESLPGVFRTATEYVSEVVQAPASSRYQSLRAQWGLPSCEPRLDLGGLGCSPAIKPGVCRESISGRVFFNVGLITIERLGKPYGIFLRDRPICL
jgi:hypothetical protein